jgi:hypothetical protein
LPLVSSEAKGFFMLTKYRQRLQELSTKGLKAVLFPLEIAVNEIAATSIPILAIPRRILW